LKPERKSKIFGSKRKKGKSTFYHRKSFQAEICFLDPSYVGGSVRRRPKSKPGIATITVRGGKERNRDFWEKEKKTAREKSFLQIAKRIRESQLVWGALAG